MATFGVTYSDLASVVLAGQTLPAAWQTVATAEITRVAAEVEILLRARGYVVATVEGYGATDSLYQTCARYITCRAGAELGRRSAMGDSDRHRQLDADADRLANMLRQIPEAVTSHHDPNRQEGSWRTHVTLTGNTTPRRARGRWRRNQST